MKIRIFRPTWTLVSLFILTNTFLSAQVLDFDPTLEGPWSDVDATTLAVPEVANGSVKLDGKASTGEYGGFEGITVTPGDNAWILDFPGDRSWDGPEDSSFTFWLVQDQDYFYVGVAVKDDVVNSDDPNAAFWRDDSVEIVVDALNDRYDNNTDNSMDPYGGHCYFNFKGRFSIWDDDNNTRTSERWSNAVEWTYGEDGDVYGVGSEVEGGWQLEVRFRKSQFEDPEAGNLLSNGYKMGFNIGLDDDDKQGPGTNGSGDRTQDLELQYWWANRARLQGWSAEEADNFWPEEIAQGVHWDYYDLVIDSAGRLSHGGTGEITFGAEGGGPGLIVYNAEEGTLGNQNFNGALGMDFELSSDITVTELGVFDSGSDGLVLPITVELWERDEDFGVEVLATLDFGPGNEGVLEGGHRFKFLPQPFNLSAGSYTIVTTGYGEGEPNVNTGGNPAADYGLFTNDAGGVITFVGGSRWGDAGEFPGNADGGPAQRYGGGTFKVLTKDTDGDGIPDTWEVANGLDMDNAKDAAEDPDGDNLSNLSEFEERLNPKLADTDGDGLKDGVELDNDTDPLNPDTDEDGLNDGDELGGDTDPLNPDTDEDGYGDGRELAEGTDPNDPDSFSVPSFAGELALMIEEGTVGNQAFGGSLGADFVVDQTVRVLELGAFDSGSDGLSRAITVKMWSREDSGTPEVPADDSGIAVLAEVEFTPNFPGDLRGGYRTIGLTDPLVLEPGAYTIVAGGYGSGEPNGNRTPGMSTTEDPIITFVGGSRYGSDPLSYPDTPDGGPANRYAAGTFAFEILGERQLTLSAEDMLYDARGASIAADGDASDWADAEFKSQIPFEKDGELVLFEEYGGGKWNGPSDHSSAVAFAWDAENLYVGIVVTDDTHQNEGMAVWNGDSVQMVFANATQDTVTHIYSYGLSDGGDVMVHNERGPGGTEVSITRDDDAMTTLYELKFPAVSLGLDAFESGMQIGIGVCVNDGDTQDGQGGQKGWSGWGPYAAVYGETASATGLVSLVGKAPGGADSGLIVYDAEEDTVGNQAFEGSLGMDFELSSGLTVTELGVFDSGSDGLTLPITVELWERDEDFGLEILATLDFGPDDEGVLEGGHRFKALPESINLPAGSYTIVAYGYGAGEPNVNTGGNSAADYGLFTNDADGVITFVGGSRWGNAGEFPGNADDGPAQRYGGGTFKVITAAGAAPAISVVRNADGTVTMTFDGTLQAAPTVNGPWQDVDGESPLTISPDQPAIFGRAVSE